MSTLFLKSVMEELSLESALKVIEEYKLKEKNNRDKNSIKMKLYYNDANNKLKHNKIMSNNYIKNNEKNKEKKLLMTIEQIEIYKKKKSIYNKKYHDKQVLKRKLLKEQ